MDIKNITIWVLSFALLGAIVEVPGLFLNQVLGSMLFFGLLTFIICCVVSYRKNRKKQLTI